jgi:phosphomannomutase
MTLIMSVSGVRGIVGQSLTREIAENLGAAYGAHLQSGNVVLGRDSRASGVMLAEAAARGLMAVGRDVIDLGIVSTPATALMIGELEACGGMVITASHNPLPWNGIKLLTHEGLAPPPEVAERVFALYRSKQFPPVGSQAVGRIRRDDTSVTRHVKRVLSTVDAAAITRRPLKIVLDSVNGAGGVEGRVLLERLGCRVVHLNGEPTGDFAHTPEPTAENLTRLCETVQREQADVGFAQDPDADRLAVVDDRGRYIGEEYTVVLAARQVFRTTPGPVAVNLSTSRMIDDLAARHGVRVHRTPVGEAHVAGAIRAHGCVIGGEGNGGVIDPRVVCVRDSLVGMARIVNLLSDEGRPLSAIVDEMPRYVMIKRKFELNADAVAAWLRRVRDLATPPATLNESDGLRIDWPEGWVHVRASNTEPIARLIAEAREEAAVMRLSEQVARLR